MSGYVLSTDADLDLGDIWEYIARDNIEAADHGIAKLFDAFEGFRAEPEMGHPRADFTQYPCCSGQLARTSSFAAPSAGS